MVSGGKGSGVHMRVQHRAGQKAGHVKASERHRSFVVWRDLGDSEALHSLLTIGTQREPSGAIPRMTALHGAPFHKPVDWRNQLPLFPGFFPPLPPVDDPDVPAGLDDTLPAGDMPGQLFLDLGFGSSD